MMDEYPVGEYPEFPWWFVEQQHCRRLYPESHRDGSPFWPSMQAAWDWHCARE